MVLVVAFDPGAPARRNTSTGMVIDSHVPFAHMQALHAYGPLVYHASAPILVPEAPTCRRAETSRGEESTHAAHMHDGPFHPSVTCRAGKTVVGARPSRRGFRTRARKKRSIKRYGGKLEESKSEMQSSGEK